MELIPAIDIIDGKCVRLSQGDYSQKTEYKSMPLEVAKNFEGVGIKRLHLVDLDGAKAEGTLNLKVLEQIASNTRLSVDFSGGISNVQRVKDCFNAGADFIAVGSVAVKQPELLEQWIAGFGSEKILLAADCRDEKIATKGWTESSDENIFEFIATWVAKGLKQGFVTDISKDGMMLGPSADLYKTLLAQQPEFNLIASGGVRSMKDIALLKELGMAGAIVGKALYEGQISLSELEKYQLENAL